ncbi:O-antigen ligase family protein [Polaribacter marinivivus]|uniref:O-antigen ligase family protein n=1 Tax=Polaribacter marinivivus TaxID=1524260 RepID=A0ABV8R9Y8_9FLAO
MEQVLTYSLFLLIVVITVKNSAISLAILLNVVVFRAIPYVDYKAPYYGYYNENDLILGAILPITCYIIILSKIFLNKSKIKYHTDVFDLFMLVLSIVMIISIIFSPNTFKSIYYTCIFLLLALPLYLVTKVYFLNTKKYKTRFLQFLKSIVIFAVAFSIVSLYLHKIAKYPYERMTFPGVYPIPFCLFLCTALIILLLYYIKPSFKLQLAKKSRILFSLPVLGIVLFSIIKTNTRGPVFAMLLTVIVLFFMFFKIKLHIKIIMSFLASLFIGFIIFISAFDVQKIAVRFINLAPKDAESISPRLIAYLDSIKLLIYRPWGISVGTFGDFYSDKNSSAEETGTYAHNLFMELISSFGIVGALLSFFFIYILLFEYNFIIRNQEKIFSNIYLFTALVLFIFFFFETQFSFTLNTHKGFYIAMAFYSVFKFKFINSKYEHKNSI